LELRLRGHRRPLVGARPARAFVQRAEPSLLVERVDLDDDAVDLVVELEAALLPGAARPGDVLDRVEPLGERIRAEAVLAQPGEALAGRGQQEPVAGADAVDPDRERPLRRDRRVLLP